MQLFIFAFLLLVYFIIHSVLASHKVKNILTSKWMAKKYYRLAFNAIAVISLLPVLLAFQTIESAYLFESTIASYFGLGFSILGVLVLLYALNQYNLAEFSGMEQLRAQAAPYPQTLKISGFNSIVRHPLYFAGLIIIWGGFVYSPSVKILLASSIATLYLYFGTKLEEQKLELEFGEEYKAYQKQVSMLIPFIF